MKVLSHILISSLAVLLAAHLLPGATVDSFGTAVAVAVVLGVVTALLVPVLLLLTFTANLPALMVLTFAITGGLVLFTARVVPGFHIANFWWALAFALMLSLINAFFHGVGAARRPAP
ncbi:MAG: phage holin family protein [Elusimicrobia bacterium]|nr:phage holin family protein [Elusimicrobiota bacterium]